MLYKPTGMVMLGGGSGGSKSASKYKKKYSKARRRLRYLNRARKTLLSFPQGVPARTQQWGLNYDEAKKRKAEGDPYQFNMRKAMRYYGPGDYRDTLRSWIPSGSFSSWGRSLGGMTGIPGMNAVGAYAGNKLSNYVGFGDYGGEAGGNQIMSGSVDKPITVNASDDLTGDIFISHREFLGNVTATGGAGNISPFSIRGFALNAGLNDSFPWLAQIAQNFTLYEFEGLIYEFKPTSGELGATGTNSLGKVVFATQYDPDAPAFTSTVQMENYDFANACKPSEHMLHGVETAPGERATKMLYVRTGTSPKDQILTDLGDLYIATEGLPITNGTTAQVGELWVTYRVKLSRAQIYGSFLDRASKSDAFIGVTQAGAAINNATTVVNVTAIIGAAATTKYDSFAVTGALQAFPKRTNTIGGVFNGIDTTQTQYDFSPGIVEGTYFVYFEIQTSNATPSGAINLGAANFTNCAMADASFCSLASTPLGQATAATANLLPLAFFVRVNAPGSLVASFRIILSGAWTNTSTLATKLVVTQVSDVLVS